MKYLLFVCHGSICRSPAAEFICKKLIKEMNLTNKFTCFSRALSNEEIGNDIYPPMKEMLNKYDVPYSFHPATLITSLDLESCDYLVYMDNENKWLIDSMFPKCKKAICLARYINKEEISDPWYHRSFDACFNEIYEAVKNLLISLNKV